MSNTAHKKASINQVFKQQVIINFVVVAVLIAVGALLVFKVQGEQYSQLTAFGYLTTVFFSFITFLPAGTLFAARAEVAQGKVAVQENEKTGPTQPLANPYLATLPMGFAAAVVCSAIAYALIYGTGWTPSPKVITLLSMVFVVPYAFIVRRYIFRDVEGLIAAGPFTAKRVPSTTTHIMMTYLLPNVIFQMIINLPLAFRGFSNVAEQIAHLAGPGMVPTQVLVPDLAITFMFVCGFTFLGVIAHTAADLYEGEFAYAGKGNGINGFLYFLIILLMGVALGAILAVGAHALTIVIMPLAIALALKALVVLFSVYMACKLGVGWMGKKFNHAVAEKTQAMGQAA